MNDKQILITGATNGIGLAAAEALAEAGPKGEGFRGEVRDEAETILA